ncbi:putative Flp pilus assembly protein TadG [Roseibium sp. TrichSKD4]|uniref:pilus assembly protein n=1 Tax=Roseibium sp. TrichSKD4 TaxID=744980 RepID=UPI0001E5704E|nr:pilus assembly protein [Roseibium sp. TrichSKD4]EFO32314.1 putative Flp pilus assembly protein TadG [Roseibium sp. TrichSKD4]
MFESKNSSYFHKFGSDERGSLLPLVAGVCLILLVVAGSAVDYGRALGYRHKIANAVDAAALTVAKQLSTTVLTENQIRTGLKNAFRANLNAAGINSQGIDNLDFKVDPGEGTLDVWSSVDIQTNFIKLGGIGPEKLEVGAASQVNYSRFDVELALVLDVTGSMRPDMNALKEASKSIVNILLPDDSNSRESKVRISLVPYSQGVNLGSYATRVTNGGSTWRNCVNERSGPQKFTDAPYNYAGSRSDFFHGKPKQFVWDYGWTEQWQTRPEACPKTAVEPLTADRTKLLRAISGLKDGGGTGGQTGIAWGWYTLSPKWKNLWPRDSAPATYGTGSHTDDTKKFALIMTDGDFNAAYGWDCGCRKIRDKPLYCRKKSNKKSWIERYFSPSKISHAPAQRAKKLCDEMKSKNIEIFTVYFDTGGATFGDDLMSYCASGSRNYYRADNSNELIQAFSNIANEIQSIYIAK